MTLEEGTAFALVVQAILLPQKMKKKKRATSGALVYYMGRFSLVPINARGR